MAYISNGAELIDIYTSTNRKTGEPMLVFVFGKEKTKELYDAWCRHELTIRDDN